MSIADAPRAPEAERLTLAIDQTDEGWFAARVEGTGAFGQGRTRDEALRNVLSALYDLQHRPTQSERLLYELRSRVAHVRDLLPR